MSLLLIVDDEPNIRYSLQTSLQHLFTEVIAVDNAGDAVETVRTRRPDVVLLDVHLPDRLGLDAFRDMRKIDPRLPVVIITAYSTTKTAIEATKQGAFDYLVKPVDLNQLTDTVCRALELSRLNNVTVAFDNTLVATDDVEPLIGRSPAMQQVYKSIGRVAPQDVTVLIQGESGTGKELVARAIYQHSRRNHLPFLPVNAAAIPDALLESEMFGHERGAFTGAERTRIGKFEQADGGTLFLDEIGDMSTATQAKLLRVLQERTFERVGGNETLTSDVRLIAATNKDLEALVEQGLFRQDLYYRLNVFIIRIPPLRERMDDLPLLIDHFIRSFNRELGRSVRSVDPEAMRYLHRHSWPGNVRELQSAVKSAILHSAGEVLTIDCFPEACRLPVEGEQTEPAPLPDESALEVAALVDRLYDEGNQDIYRHVHAELDRLLMNAVLRKTQGSQLLAAEVLGISRTTLRAKLRALGFSIEKQLTPESGRDEKSVAGELP
ncbi:MAG: sigma-54-dependent Fis family transcriptional regulator [Planctomycetaceae bacterium]|nr:sigma-54-dependent Fis family transcriptional regulator [Planctomycetaceae bacterium]